MYLTLTGLVPRLVDDPVQVQWQVVAHPVGLGTSAVAELPPWLGQLESSLEVVGLVILAGGD